MISAGCHFGIHNHVFNDKMAKIRSEEIRRT